MFEPESLQGHMTMCGMAAMAPTKESSSESANSGYHGFIPWLAKKNQPEFQSSSFLAFQPTL